MRDAWFQRAGAAAVAEYARRKGIGAEEAAARLERDRERYLEAMRGNAYALGYEPDIWLVAKALMRGAPVTKPERERVERELNMGWDEFARRMRLHLGFRQPVSELLVMGANRSGKTDFASKLAMQIADGGGKSVAVGFQTLKTGKGTQMKRLWNYMPQRFRDRNIALGRASRIDEHISYTEQNGFAGSKITFGNGSRMDFITYEMDVRTIEGSEYDFGWLDEEFPMGFLTTLRSRLASRRGTLLGTFTPISGYTPVVADYLDGMLVAKWRTAYMLPRDGGGPLPWRELGLSEGEYAALMRQEEGGGDCGIPEARPERCLEWLKGGAPERAGVDGGRCFARVPRVAICKGGAAAAIWFYGSDNPYGRPQSVIESAARNRRAAAEIRARVYGIAERLTGRLFANFSRERNVVRPEEIPARLVRFMVVDPAPERNWSVGWYGYDRAADVLYKYREWPGRYEIPGVGVPPPWAQLSDRNRGVNDGEYAGGQEDFGMSFLKYKYEWARLEGWRDFEAWAQGRDPLEWPEDLSAVAEWSDAAGARERMALRVIDARAAAQSKMSRTENLTLFDEVSRLAEGFVPASGQRIEVGLSVLRDRIETGRYRISSECANTVFSYENYTGRDGQRGAVKDWIDGDRYAALCEVYDYPPEAAAEIGEGGGAAQGRTEPEAEDFAPWSD